ncbi:hypothetical protein NKDENANG_02750 [Candidatus Entotheonellaceae bacterium PAL068K]
MRPWLMVSRQATAFARILGCRCAVQLTSVPSRSVVVNGARAVNKVQASKQLRCSEWASQKR